MGIQNRDELSVGFVELSQTVMVGKLIRPHGIVNFAKWSRLSAGFYRLISNKCIRIFFRIHAGTEAALTARTMKAGSG